MKYSDEELLIIYEKRLDLRKKPNPSTDTAVIEFLKKNDILSQLSKNMSSKEWFSLKQSILNHKDFPKFQTDHFYEVTEHNQKIDKMLEDSQTQKELDLLIKQYAIPERIRQYSKPFYSKYKMNPKVRIKKKSFFINFFHKVVKILRNKFIRFFVNLLFVFIWFIFSVLIWAYIEEWLEYENIYLNSLWVSGLPPFYISTSFLLIFGIPSYFFSKYIWFRESLINYKRKRVRDSKKE